MSSPSRPDVTDINISDLGVAAYAQTTPKYQASCNQSGINDDSHASEGFHLMEDSDTESRNEEEDVLYQSMVDAGNEAVDYINQSFGGQDESIVRIGEENEIDNEGEGGVESDVQVKPLNQVPALRQSACEVQLARLNLSNASDNAEWRLMESDDESDDTSIVAAQSPAKKTPNSSPPKVIAASTRTPLKTLSESEIVDDENRGLRGTGWKQVPAATTTTNSNNITEPETTTTTTATHSPSDEWRLAKTPEGKTYYYNRRTRESSWKLPSGATPTPSKSGVYSVPRTEGKQVSRPKANANSEQTLDHDLSASPSRNFDSRISSIVTPSRNPNLKSESPMTQMTPDGVDPQDRQRKAKHMKEARTSFNSSVLNGTTLSTAEAQYNNGSNISAANNLSATSTMKKKMISMSRAESSAKSASEVLEKSHIYEQLDKTFTSDVMANGGREKETTKESENRNKSTTRKANPTPSTSSASGVISPPPPLVHNVSRRRLFDENSAATQCVFCVYCGHQTPPGLLNAHMQECFVFQRTWQAENGNTQKQVEGAIMRAWGMNLVKDKKEEKKKSPVKKKSMLPDVVKRKGKQKVDMKALKGGGGAAAAVVSPDQQQAKQDKALFVCPGCGDDSCTSREELLSHMRACASKIDAAPTLPDNKYGGRAKAGQVCPWCAQPVIKLSNHLARCRQAKKAREKKMGVLPGGDGIMSMTM